MQLPPMITGAIVKRKWGALRNVVKKPGLEDAPPRVTRVTLPPSDGAPARRIVGVQVNHGSDHNPDLTNFERFLQTADWSAGTNSNEWAKEGLPDSLELDVQEL